MEGNLGGLGGKEAGLCEKVYDDLDEYYKLFGMHYKLSFIFLFLCIYSYSADPPVAATCTAAIC